MMHSSNMHDQPSCRSMTCRCHWFLIMFPGELARPWIHKAVTNTPQVPLILDHVPRWIGLGLAIVMSCTSQKYKMTWSATHSWSGSQVNWFRQHTNIAALQHVPKPCGLITSNPGLGCRCLCFVCVYVLYVKMGDPHAVSVFLMLCVISCGGQDCQPCALILDDCCLPNKNLES